MEGPSQCGSYTGIADCVAGYADIPHRILGFEEAFATGVPNQFSTLQANPDLVR
jgi:hypothetical protein